jgi:hypothetical protein
MRKLLIFLTSIFLLDLAWAQAIGIGMSPASITLRGYSGQKIYYDFLIYNPGDVTVLVTIEAEGEIADFVDIPMEAIHVEPEPKPAKLPPVRGRIVRVWFNVPPVTEPTTFEGRISAIASPAEGIVGGIFKTSSLVTFHAEPSPVVFWRVLWGYITSPIFIAFIIIIILIIFYWAKKKFKIVVVKKPKKKAVKKKR